MIELEKTYLAKYLPEGLQNCPMKEIIDLYIPKESDHAKLRLRKNGDKYEITKKTLIDPEDASRQIEETIHLTQEEFTSLKILPAKKISKQRYFYDYQGKVGEIDVFNGDLAGLVLIDFEFQNVEEQTNFAMPDFCLVEITQEEFIAGGVLCGKSYEDILPYLEKFEYKKIG